MRPDYDWFGYDYLGHSELPKNELMGAATL